ncbi:MAG: 50S ribosomal protein L29 [Bacteroidota bacterium]|nr:50S ribosomal protein L29 [Bacteroidota bacterium]
MKQLLIKDLSTKELEEKLADEISMLTRMKLNHSVSPIENPMKIKTSRKAIARFKTELKMRSIKEKK